MIQLEFTAMASPCSIRVDGVPESELDLARAAVKRAHAEVLRIEHKYSRYRADSVVGQINARAGGEPTVCDEETAGLLDFAGGLFVRSGGRFDITSGVLSKAWDFRQARLPEPAVLESLLARVGWSRVQWDGLSIRLPQAGMEIDLGGFGKEYAADRAAQVLSDAGLLHALIDLGGDVRALGPRADGKPWQVGIRHPRKNGAILARFALDQGGLATSGDYERYFEHEGHRYCHILDARSGWPVAYWQSVSVVAPSCLAAGAMATLCMLWQAEGEALIRESGLPCLAVGPRGERLQIPEPQSRGRSG